MTIKLFIKEGTGKKVFTEYRSDRDDLGVVDPRRAVDSFVIDIEASILPLLQKGVRLQGSAFNDHFTRDMWVTVSQIDEIDIDHTSRWDGEPAKLDLVYLTVWVIDPA